MSKELKFLIIHCTATPEGRNVQPNEVKKWHEDRWGEGAIGYRSLVLLDGDIHMFRKANNDRFVQPEEITYHARGYNSISHGIAYVGGMNAEYTSWKDTRTQEQKDSLEYIIKYYISTINPQILIAGHNQMNTAKGKACPSFWIPKFCREIGIPESNIYKEDPFKWKPIMLKSA